MVEPDPWDTAVLEADDDGESTSDDDGDGSDSRRRERSTIKFPYLDIRDAMTVASKLKAKFGSGCTLDQMAAALDQVPTSGAFRTRISSAVVFGVITSKAGQVTLTDLGHAVADEHTRRDAQVKAFMHVPLYSKLYTEFQGKSLPSGSGLERVIEGLGVVPKQSARARQVFQRSADAAGMFWSGKDRLVIPPAATPAGSGSSTAKDDGRGDTEQDGKKNGDGSPKLSDAPLLQALWDTLPDKPPFTVEQRKRFFTALAFNIDYVYGDPGDGRLDPEGVAKLWTANVATSGRKVGVFKGEEDHASDD